MTTRGKFFLLPLLAAILLAASLVPAAPVQAYWRYEPGYYLWHPGYYETIPEQQIWHDGYWQYHAGACTWVEGHYESFWVSGYNRWVEGHYEVYWEWDPVIRWWVQKQKWVPGYWEWVDGYWSQYWVEGHESCAPGYNTWIEGYWEIIPAHQVWHEGWNEWIPGHDVWVPDSTPPVVSVGYSSTPPPAAGQTVTITWTASDSGGGISWVELWRTDNGTSTVYYEGSNGQTSTTMVAEAGHAYTFTVKAWDKDNNLAEASTSFTVPLPDTTKPTVTLQVTAGSSINVTWTASDAGGLKSVIVTQQDSPGTTTTLYNNTGGGTTHTVTAVAGTTHTFSITAQDKAGNSASLSKSVTVPVPPPADTTPPGPCTVTVQAVVTNPTFYVRVEASDNAGGSGIAKYDMEYYDQSVNQWKPWLTGVPPVEGNLYQFDGVSGKTYMFRARAVDRAGNAAPMPERSQAMTFVDGYAPTAFMTNAPYSNEVRPTVTWMGVDDDAANLVYTVWYRSASGSENVLISETTLTSTQTPFTAAEGTYEFKVQARDRAGRLSAVSTWSAMVVDREAPYDIFISQLDSAGTELQNDYVDVLYRANDTVSGIASRELLSSEEWGPFTPWLSGLSSDGQQRFSPLQHGMHYRFRLVVKDGANNVAEMQTQDLTVVLYKHLPLTGKGKVFDYYISQGISNIDWYGAIKAGVYAWNSEGAGVGVQITHNDATSRNRVYVGDDWAHTGLCGEYTPDLGAGFEIKAVDKPGCGILQNTIVHEFGHALGLADLRYGAVQVMGYKNSSLLKPTSYDLEGVRTRW